MGQRLTVLVVDDHAMVAEGIAEVLALEPDLEVVDVVGSGADGVRAALHHRPDVVLMDQHLGDLDGTVAARRIRERLPDTNVIVVTSQDEDRVLLDAIEAGCVGVIAKHRRVEEVVEAVRRVGGGASLITPAVLARLMPALRSAPATPPPAHGLSTRELEVLQRLATGASNQDIADELYISLKTVRNHVQRILAKLHAHSKLEAVSLAVRRGIIDFPQ